MADDANNIGSAIAGGLIAVSLLHTLRDKDILSLTEVRGVLDRALRAVGPSRKPEDVAASRIIQSLLGDQFPMNRS